MSSWAAFVNFHTCTRAAGIQLCGQLWHRLYHIGDVRSDSEFRSIYDPTGTSLSNEYFSFYAVDDDDPEYQDGDQL